MTREELGNRLSANVPTRTMAELHIHEGYNITDEWEVTYIDLKQGVLYIYCVPPVEEAMV